MRRRLTAVFLAAGLSACAAGPDYAAPQPDAPETYSRMLEGAAEAPAGPPWWAGFEAEALDALIARALDENLDIAQAARRLAAAEALAGAAQADFFPTLDGGADATLRSGAPDQASAGLSLGQIVDINGRLRRAREQARAEVLASRYSLADVRRLTAASVASLYVEARRAEARLALLDASLELQQRTLDIVELRADAGLSADLDVRRAAADLARTRAQRGALTLQLARARNALSVLVAETPGRPIAGLDLQPEAGAAADAFALSYRGALPVGEPADLLRRRPDLRAAEARLRAASAAAGVREAALYPSLRLPGAITADLSDGVGDDLAASLGAVLDVPLFDFGRRRAELTAAEARAAEAALAYEQAVLRALEEVETGLVAIESVNARLEDLEIAVDQSERAYDQLNALYREGLASFIDVLDAQRQLIASRESLVDSRADLADAVIDLNLAIAAPAG
ncbi:hypothetical protein AY599_10620 [Leptolyngbya valderiana BDU 20041]|nr:hypothetical protein AY599_10620 [Leptolyngbya valderiana BDU 20041]